MLTSTPSNIMLFWRFFLMVKKIFLRALCHSRASVMPYSLRALCHTLRALCHTLATAMPYLCDRYAMPLRPLCHAFATAMPCLCDHYVIPIATAMPYPLRPLCHTRYDRYAIPLNRFFYDFFGLKTNDMDLVFVIYCPGFKSSNFYKIIQ